jgi:hypothetical protein
MCENKMKNNAKLAAAIAATLAAGLQWTNAAEWNNNAGGNWNVAENWTPNDVPDTTDEDASINLDGTYTVAWNLGSVAKVDNVTIGTTTTSGTQTLQTSNSGAPSFNNMTIGPRGIFYQPNQNIGGATNGSGTITIQNGGIYRITGRNSGGHNVDINAGGTWEILTGTTTASANALITVNGLITGPGTLKLNSNGISFAGNGVIDNAGLLEGDFTNMRVHRWGGSVTVNRDWDDGLNGLALLPGASITLNGNYTASRTSQNATFNTDGDGTGTVLGSGSISVTSTGSGNPMPFGGIGTNTNGTVGGTMTFAGTGSLSLTAGSIQIFRLMSANLNLQRDTTFSGTSTGFFEQASNNKINVSGATTTMTVNSGAVIRAADQNRQINVNGGAELALNGGILEGLSDGTDWNLRIGQSTAGTLTLKAGQTSTLRAHTSHVTNRYHALLDANASVNAETGSVLQLAGANLRIDITDSSNWGLKSAGEIRIAGNDVTLEALSNDLGNLVSVAVQPLSIATLSFADFGSDVLLNLWDNTDNDGAGADTALYVQTLDLSELLSGRTLEIGGLAGTERIYYETLVNPNNVAFDSAKIVQVVPEPGSIGIVLAAGGLLMVRRRRA